jgi:hypothetical protein
MLSLTNSLALALATLALAPEATFGRSGSASKRSSKSPYLRKSGADGWSAKGDPYGYHSALGQSLKFLEVQRSGRLSKSPGGYRVNWRHDQLLDDGKDVGMDLVGGWYEAGSARPSLFRPARREQCCRPCAACIQQQCSVCSMCRAHCTSALQRKRSSCLTQASAAERSYHSGLPCRPAQDLAGKRLQHGAHCLQLPVLSRHVRAGAI